MTDREKDWRVALEDLEIARKRYQGVVDAARPGLRWLVDTVIRENAMHMVVCTTPEGDNRLIVEPVDDKLHSLMALCHTSLPQITFPVFVNDERIGELESITYYDIVINLEAGLDEEHVYQLLADHGIL